VVQSRTYGKLACSYRIKCHTYAVPLCSGIIHHTTMPLMIQDTQTLNSVDEIHIQGSSLNRCFKNTLPALVDRSHMEKHTYPMTAFSDSPNQNLLEVSATPAEDGNPLPCLFHLVQMLRPLSWRCQAKIPSLPTTQVFWPPLFLQNGQTFTCMYFEVGSTHWTIINTLAQCIVHEAPRPVRA